MDFTNIPLTKSIEPYLEYDGGVYPVCHRCWAELAHKQKVCHNCHQLQDWSWLDKFATSNVKEGN